MSDKTIDTTLGEQAVRIGDMLEHIALELAAAVTRQPVRASLHHLNDCPVCIATGKPHD